MATAHAIQEQAVVAGKSVDISIIESDSRPGGKIKSDFIDGWLCEGGPPGFIDNKPEVLDVCQKLELGPEFVISNDAYRKRFIFVDGKLQQLPMSPAAFLKTKMLSWPAKLRVLFELRSKLGDPQKDESIAEFAQRHLGKEIVEKLISAMAVGIFAGDAEKLSLRSCFPVMLALEKEGGGSLIKAQIRRQKAKRARAKTEEKKDLEDETKSEGMVGSSGKLTTFKRGMGQIIDRLQEKISGEVLTGMAATGLTANDGQYEVEFASGEKIVADVVVLAVPGYAAAKILSELDGGLSELIDNIPYVPVNVVIFGYDKRHIDRDMDGFGFLAPKREKRGILGTLWTSSIFDGQVPRDKVAMRTMVGGAFNPDNTRLNDNQTVEMVQKELYDIMGVSGAPEFVHIIRHEKAIPQYVIGHADRVLKINDAVGNHPGLFLTGNAYKGVSFNDCVINAGLVAEKVINFLENTKKADQPKIQPPSSSK